jgi:hypothetical protein
MDPPETNPHQQLAATALSLAAEATAKLQRWLALFEQHLAKAEDEKRLAELKDFAIFLTALKRSLEIANIAQLLREKDHHDNGQPIDPATLRRYLLEED